MENKFKLKVNIGNVKKETPVISSNTTMDEPSISLNSSSSYSSIEPKVMVTFNDYESKNPEMREFLISVYKMLYNGVITTEIASGVIILEIQRSFYECVRDRTSNDIDTLKYMEEVLFNDLKYIINFLLIHSISNKYARIQQDIMNQKYGNIRLVIERMITNAVHLVDYDEVFNFEKIKDDIDEFYHIFLS